jgi:hypothetical protein
MTGKMRSGIVFSKIESSASDELWSIEVESKEEAQVNARPGAEGENVAIATIRPGLSPGGLVHQEELHDSFQRTVMPLPGEGNDDPPNDFVISGMESSCLCGAPIW